MRLVGQAERSLAAACERVEARQVFGRKLSAFDNVLQVGEVSGELAHQLTSSGRRSRAVLPVDGRLAPVRSTRI
jgi:hypothetical protein